MAQIIGRLTALQVSRVRKPGLHGDGAGLYLQVTGSGAKSWIFRYMLNGRSRDMGLGSLAAVGLADARTKAAECRRMRQEGIDPIEARRAQRTQAEIEVAKSISFKECAKGYIKAHRAGWKNTKHAAQWENTLLTYVYPTFGDLPVQAVDTGLVLKAIEPIWATKPETASRVRGRIEAILDWAKARSFRSGENPARWRGHLDHLLPTRSKVRRVKHHPALPYDELPAFMQELRQQSGVAARALEFLILTAARTTEVIEAVPDEIKSRDNTWVVPAERMKADKDHRIPLSEAALAVLEAVPRLAGGKYLFPGGREDRPLSNNAMLALLERMDRGDITVHGFRSTFDDWAAERTNFPREVAEAALAHTIENKTEAAYRRGDLFNKRRQLMDAWARYCVSKVQKGTAVPIERKS